VWNDEWNYLGGSVIDPMILCPVHINVVQWPCSRVARLCDRPFLLENSKAWSAAKDDETREPFYTRAAPLTSSKPAIVPSGRKRTFVTLSLLASPTVFSSTPAQ
jgi:hypothetical protein